MTSAGNPLGNLVPSEALGFSKLLRHGPGKSNIRVGIVDGQIDREHRALQSSNIIFLTNFHAATPSNSVMAHGTFITGMLAASSGNTWPPGLCSACTFLVRPIYTRLENTRHTQTSSYDELGNAIIDCIKNGAHIINVSSSLIGEGFARKEKLVEALNQALAKGVPVVCSSGNGATVMGSTLISHPATLPVVGYSRTGKINSVSNLSRSTGVRGLGAPSENIIGLAPGGGLTVSSGTSVAAPFVSATLALLLGIFPKHSIHNIRRAMIAASGARLSIIPPALKPDIVYQLLLENQA